MRIFVSAFTFVEVCLNRGMRMMTTFYAIFDGKVLRPEGPVPLEPNTRVRITIEAERENESKTISFLRTEQVDLDGPSAWLARFRELRSEALAQMRSMGMGDLRDEDVFREVS